jgi:septal ring factor EnvC (AmiA/AmiB activator)
MQEELKVTPKTRTITDIPSNGHQSKDSKAASEAAPLKVTLERPESIAAREAAQGLKIAERRDTIETVSAVEKSKHTDLTVTPSKPSPLAAERRGMFSSSSSLMPMAALGALLIAGMSFTSLKTTRSELAALTEAKASVDKSLAETQGRLTVAEKTIADIKAAIAAATTTAAAKTSEPVLETAPVPAAVDAAKTATETPSNVQLAPDAPAAAPPPATEAKAAAADEPVTKTGLTTEVPPVTAEPKAAAPVDAKQP